MFRRLAAVALLAAPALAAPSARAQTASIADSVLKLNRAGPWDQAGPLVMRSLPTVKTAEDRCALLIGGAYSAARVFLVEAATRTLRTIDAECLNTAVARQMASDVASIRAAITLPAMPNTGVELSALSSSLNRVRSPLGTAPEATMIGALFSLRNEGIADLVDKPHPLVSRSAAMAAYVASYNDLYDRTPAILHGALDL